MCTSDIFLGLIAILFPPIAVWIKVGLCSADSLINILLCMLGFIPGLLHAWYIIAKYPDPADASYAPIDGNNDGGESGRVTYYYVGPAQQYGGQQGGSVRGAHQHQPQNQGYGGVSQGMRAEGQQQPKPQRPQRPQQGDGGEGGSGGAVPPSYEQAVRGNHKVQT